MVKQKLNVSDENIKFKNENTTTFTDRGPLSTTSLTTLNKFKANIRKIQCVIGVCLNFKLST